ncbi:MAG: glycoside hydrolase [Blastocatellia bacterium]
MKHHITPGLSSRISLSAFITRLAVVLFGVITLLPASARAQNRIYIAPDDHTDYVWTLDEEGYRNAFVLMLDYYLAKADETAGDAPQYQSRWNCDGSLWLWEYERNKTPAEFNRLIERIRDGHISAPLNALVSVYGGTPAEAVLRGMYYPGTLERRYNLRFPLVQAIENHTLPYGLGALWAGAGAKYTWRGLCNCRYGTKIENWYERDHDMYWWTAMDGSRLLMKWNQVIPGQFIGSYFEGRFVNDAIEHISSDPAWPKHYPYNVSSLFGYGGDDPWTLDQHFVEVAKAKTNATRQVIVSNQEDFFRDFATSYGAQLPTVAASFGNEWDVYIASMAEVTARTKRAVEKLRTAEALATLVSLQQPAFMNARRAAAEQTWMDMGLYWEHDWTGDGGISRDARAAFQRKLTGRIEDYVNTLQNDAATALGGLIKSPGGNQRFYAFNSLSWARTDIADLPYTGTDSINVVDVSTGQEAPSQIVTFNSQRYLRILARDIPAVGYKVFEIRPGAGNGFATAATASGNILENDRYRISVADRGAITSLIDKTNGSREFVREINGRAINDLGPGGGVLEIENAGPVSVTLRATANGPLSHVTRVTLVRDKDRIDIKNQITQNFGGEKHTWGFGLNLNGPDVWHEEVGAVIRAKLTTQGGHYSPRNARYDWQTLNHFADVSANGAGPGLTMSSPDLSFMQLGNSTPNQLDTTTPLISVLAGGQIDGALFGIPSQGGDTSFTQRFALRTRNSYSGADAMRFALEHQNPLIAAPVTGNGSAAYPDHSYSLVTISNPDVLLWALKPAEEGMDQGLIARVWNLAGGNAGYTLKLARPLSSAQAVTHIETNQGPANVVGGLLSANATTGQIQTFRLFPGETVVPRTLINTSAATYSRASLARESIVAAFGTGLATGTQAATNIPLPTTLAGTTVTVRDSQGIDRLAPLFFVSPNQINYQIPPGTASGAATINVRGGDGGTAAETIQVSDVAPGLFTADSSGQGLAVAIVLRVTGGAVTSVEPVSRFDPGLNQFVPVPIDLNAGGEQIYLVPFGTGFRFHGEPLNAQAAMGSVVAEVQYAGATGGLIGLDQLNILLPGSLTGAGVVNMNLTIDGKAANTVRVAFR